MYRHTFETNVIQITNPLLCLKPDVIFKNFNSLLTEDSLHFHYKAMTKWLLQ